MLALKTHKWVPGSLKRSELQKDGDVKPAGTCQSLGPPPRFPLPLGRHPKSSSNQAKDPASQTHRKMQVLGEHATFSSSLNRFSSSFFRFSSSLALRDIKTQLHQPAQDNLGRKGRKTEAYGSQWIVLEAQGTGDRKSTRLNSSH